MGLTELWIVYKNPPPKKLRAFPFLELVVLSSM